MPDANVLEQEKVNAVDVVERDARAFGEWMVGWHGNGKCLGHEPCVRYHGQQEGLLRYAKVDAAILTQLAFYAGWPNAWAAFRMAKEVYDD